MRKTLKPIEIAYRDYMRTYTGCFPSTPIPLLHAISGFPLLKDKIITETTMTVLAAQANGTILGREYTAWHGEGDGWTPLGEVWKALKERIPESYEAVHARVNISAQTLEGLYKVRYHKSNRQQAIKKNRKGKLLPVKPDVEIWTDGSYNLNNGGGAAALLIDHKRNAEDKTPDEVEIGSKLGQSVTSSYECEIIALNIGLEVAIEKAFQDRDIHIMTDSLSWMSQLQSIPTKPRRVNAIVAECTSKLAQLTQDNRVDIHFIPSHVAKCGNDDSMAT